MIKLLHILLFISLPFITFSQNIKGDDLRIKEKSRLIGQVTIGSKSFDNSAILTLTDTDRGLLIPRMTTAQRDGIGSPSTGLLIYNTTTNQFEFFESTWEGVGGTMGDMLRAIYDTNSDNLVDDSDSLNGQSGSFYLSRANHTGTQTVSTISDFDTEVSNNASVTANTAKVTNVTHTGDVTGSGLLTIASKAVEITTLDDGTDGELITWDATGVAATVATGSAGEVLTSNGVGTAPTFQADGGGVSFGSATRVPFMNGTADDFDYSLNFLFDDATKTLALNKTTSGDIRLRISHSLTGANDIPLLRLEGAGVRTLDLYQAGLGFSITRYQRRGIITTGGASLGITYNSGGDHIWETDGIGRLIIDNSSNGNIGIGLITGISARLQVAGVNAAATSDCALFEDNVGTDLMRIKNNGDVITHQTLNFHSDTSVTNDTYGIVEPLIIAYVTGMNLYISIGVANTGAATIQFNALSAIAIKKLHDQDLVTGDIETDQIIHVIYDGTNFQMLSQLAQ